MSLAIAEREALVVSVARDEGDTAAATAHPFLAAEQPLEPAPVSPRILGPLSAKTLGEIVSLITAAEKKAPPASVYEYEVAVRMFEEHLGEARPVYAITGATCCPTRWPSWTRRQLQQAFPKSIVA